MNTNKRDSNRAGLVIDIKLICEDKSECILKSQNIIDTGVFLEQNAVQLDGTAAAPQSKLK